MDTRKLILERAEHEIACVWEGCNRALLSLDCDSRQSVSEALSSLQDLQQKLADAEERLQVLLDAEEDAVLSPYLIAPTQGHLARFLQALHTFEVHPAYAPYLEKRP